MDRLEEIEARAEKATPGQWRLWSRGEPITDPAWAAGKVGCCGIGPFDKPVISQWAGYGYISPADEDFLLYAREDIPWLVDQLRAARAEAERMRGWVWWLGKHRPLSPVAKVRAIPGELYLITQAALGRDFASPRTEDDTPEPWESVVARATTRLNEALERIREAALSAPAPERTP